MTIEPGAHLRPDPGSRLPGLGSANSGDGSSEFTLLLVDDESGVLKALRRIFLDDGHRILTAESGAAALEIMGREVVHLVVSDHRMPGMIGTQLLRQIKQKWPETVRIMLTGDADVESVMAAVNEGAVYKFVTKPWNDEELRLTVSLALQQFVLVRENRELKQINARQQTKITECSAALHENRGVLGMYLVQEGVVGKGDLDLAGRKKMADELLGDALVRLGLASEEKIAEVLGKRLKFAVIDLEKRELSPSVVKFLPREFCERNRLIPIAVANKKLTIAMADPSDFFKCDHIAMMTGLNVAPVVAKSSAILRQLQRFTGQSSEVRESDLVGESELVAELEPHEGIDILLEENLEPVNIEELIAAAEIPPIMRVVNLTIADAIRLQASDIHIEPKALYTVVRFRSDGLLVNRLRIPAELHPAIISRIKIIAKMDISERRKPQDGRIAVKVRDKLVDIRVSTMPTINGEKVAMRLLDKSSDIKKMEDLGVLPRDFNKLRELIKKPQGIIIATGPTGSGKTTMLYSVLNAMLDGTRNFQTIEDPVEYLLEDANQIFVKDKIGFSFSSILRATLRQDPDVILVGEIRDPETADVSFKAALTGHMVLTTLHTNNSVASITRLMDIGVRPYLIASAVEGILAQRLVRKVCRNCCHEVAPDQEALRMLKISQDKFPAQTYKGRGCEQCHYTGYSGRTGVFELFVMNDEFRHLISTAYKEAELVKMARVGGMHTLLEDGLEKVKNGVTTLEEILRVIGSQTRFERECEWCRQVIDLNFLFCPYCGKLKKNLCLDCRMPLEAEWRSCPACGREQAS